MHQFSKGYLTWGIILSLGLASAISLAQETPVDVSGEKHEGLAITVYNQNLALVKDIRLLSLKDGRNDILFTDVAAKIDPTSVHFMSLSSPESCIVREQNYQYDLVDREKLMQKYVDREIEVVRYDQNGKEIDRQKGLLLSSEGGAASVIKVGDKLVLNPPGTIELPSLPSGLITKPTLQWLLETTQSGRHRVEVSYLTGGLDWRADYVAVVSPRDDKVDLSSWVTINNQSGASYPFAKLKLVAGDVHRVQPSVSANEKRMIMATAAPAQQFDEKAFFEYHLYTLDRKTSLRDNETKQLSLFQSPGVSVKKRFVFDPARSSYGAQDSQKQKVNVMLELKNAKDSGLGMPLPKGKVRVYKADEDGSLEFIGEDEIDHTPRDETFRLNLGNAFDLVGERKQTALRQIADRVQEMDVEISLRNHKTDDVDVSAVEHLWGDWNVLKETHDHLKKDANTIEFPVTIPKNGEVKIRYTVQIKW